MKEESEGIHTSVSPRECLGVHTCAHIRAHKLLHTQVLHPEVAACMGPATLEVCARNLSCDTS